MYLNTATNLLKSRMSWILTLPRALLSSGETWDSLIDELVGMGLFVEVTPNQVPELTLHELGTEESLGIPTFDGSTVPIDQMGASHE